MNKALTFSKFDTKQIVFLFIIIFGPVAVLAGIRIDSRIFVMLGIVFFGLIYFYKNNQKIIIPFIKIQSVFIISLGILFLYISLQAIYLEENYYFWLVVRIFFIYIFTIILISLIKNNQKFIDRYYDYIFYITFINAIIIILMAHVAPLRNFIQSFQYQTALLAISGNIRMQGLNGMEGATLSVMMFFGAISYYYMTKQGFKEKIYLILISYSMIYIGRTGLLFILIYFIFKALKYYYKKYGIISVGVVPMVGFVVYFIASIFLDNLYLFPIEYQHTFRFLSSIGTTETGLPYTIDLLLRDISFPDYFKHNIWFGTFKHSLLPESGYFSDLGYIKMIFTIGYIGLFLYMLIYIVFLYFAFYLRPFEKTFSYIISLVLFLLLFHFKANALVMTAMYFLIFLSFNISLLRLKSSRAINE